MTTTSKHPVMPNRPLSSASSSSEESMPFVNEGGGGGGARRRSPSRPEATKKATSPSSSSLPSHPCPSDKRRGRGGGSRTIVSSALCAAALLATGAFFDRAFLVQSGDGMGGGCESPTADDAALTTPRSSSSSAGLSPLFPSLGYNRTSDQMTATGGVNDPESPALFLFLLGIEGTGHHLFMDVYRKSPSFKRLSSWGYVYDGKYRRLLASLFDMRKMEKGLWSAACAPMGWGNNHKSDLVDGTALMDETVSALKDLERGIRANHDKVRYGSRPTVVAIGGIRLGKGRRRKKGRGSGRKKKTHNENVSGGEGERRRLREDTDDGDAEAEGAEEEEEYDDEEDDGREEDEEEEVKLPDSGKNGDAGGMNGKTYTGMLSYPNFGGPCRTLQYPDLSLLYDACSEAGVNCAHVFLHRDPYSAVRSVLNRGLAGGIAAVQMRVADTMLHVARTQLEDFPERLAACWDYGDDAGGIRDGGETGSLGGGGVLKLAEILGWDRAEFKALYQDMYQKPKPLTEEDREKLTLGGQLEPYMRGVVRSMGRVVETCKVIYESNQRQQEQ